MIQTAKPSNKSFDPIPPLSLEFTSAGPGYTALEYNQRVADQDLMLQILLTKSNGYKWVEEEFFRGEKRSNGKYTHNYPDGLKDIRYTLIGISEGSGIPKIVTRTVEF